MHISGKSATRAGFLIALGIIYGDIGTSPLYVLNAITNGRIITEELIVGALSCIIWTLTLQTTIKYVILTLRADNNGEGGIFSLYALVRRRKRWLVLPAIIGGATLLADGMITPPISVTSAIEGLKQVPFLGITSQWTIVIIVIAILSVLFFLQQFGTAFIGKFFGPIMATWFLMLAALGISHLFEDLSIFKAFNPYYAIHILTLYPGGFFILGGVFLCTTGAEALYSDLGHCGKWNIRYSWIFVKSCLILNYLGQGAWLLTHHNRMLITPELVEAGFNPFYGTMPSWFLYFGIAIATAATIIASQALISGSFTLISEAMRLNLWPKLQINYPTEERGQLYIPATNLLLYVGCVGIVLYFQKASNMESAYGLAITLTMLATSILLANYLLIHGVSRFWVGLYLLVYLSIESAFFYANLGKFTHGGYVTVIMGGVIFLVMYGWYKARKIKNRYLEFVRLADYLPKLQDLSNDRALPKYATHLIYLTSADDPKEIEHKIVYSILNRSPKRADLYWFVHVETLDDPYTVEYKVSHIIPNEVIRIDFRLGFRVQPRIDLMYRKVLAELIENKEVNVRSRYDSGGADMSSADFSFVVMEKFLSQDNELPLLERVIMRFHFFLKRISLSEERGFGLDPGNVVIEKFPLIIAPVRSLQLTRVFED